ncbi:ABC transporter ATP-binding protein [Arthrobacter sp. HY1533]|uniref:ABC transporter ATP-binding protein n=1 Tax=Arthrobacter sp. HY1533 TaxID=2970919 RepID=UPI0022BA08F5|nr:ABC transporter ATP-binding protein [Arthrobacter sp. HY1533]
MTIAAEFIGVSQSFGDFLAVDNLDLKIEEGKLTTLLGPSGCGKTTTLRMLAGYGTPTKGRITIGGKDATTLPPEKRNLGMVFQSYALFPHMTVAENVAYGLKIRKVAQPERTKRVMESLELVGLAHLAGRRPKALSGGQQQRVALARAIAIRPALLLLDEPLSNLDARLRVQMRSEIRRIQAETSLSVVLVTHDQDEALEMSDTMVLMREGKIMQQGAPEQVFPAPANRFVAEFLGYENFIVDPTRGLLTVRPEHLRVASGETEPALASAGLALPATVTSSAYRGVDLVITTAVVNAAGEEVPLVSTVRRDSLAAGFAGHNRGDKVTVYTREVDLVSLPG